MTCRCRSNRPPCAGLPLFRFSRLSGYVPLSALPARRGSAQGLFSPRRFAPLWRSTPPSGTDSEISSKMTSLRILFESPAVFKTAGLSSNTEGAGGLIHLRGERRPIAQDSLLPAEGANPPVYTRPLFCRPADYKNRSAIPIRQSIRCSAMSRVKPAP